MNNRIVAVFTGNRAEYGLQYPILKAIDHHSQLDYRLIVSGAHLDDSFGRTLSEIQADGFHIHAQASIAVAPNHQAETALAIASAIESIANILAESTPDLLLIYADRFESFAAAIAASQMNIPTAHVEGGDLTEGGALDDSVRHAITKLSHIHFTTNKEATSRVLSMGEEPWRVHTVGLPAIDLISQSRYASVSEVQSQLNLDLQRPVILFTQHSITTEAHHAAQQLNPSLQALLMLAKEGVQCILTYPNNDSGGQTIATQLESFNALSNPNIQLHHSLGRHLYHGVLALSLHPAFRIACVGNSSSGIKETPAFMCPTVNIGSRQMGRLRAQNVIDVPYVADDIYKAAQKCLFDTEFRRFCRDIENPYWVGEVGPKIAHVLSTVKLDQRLIRKRMTI